MRVNTKRTPQRADTDSSAGGVDGETLDGICRTETIANRVDFPAIRGQLPAEWDVRPDLVQFGSEPLGDDSLSPSVRGSTARVETDRR